MRAGRAVNDGPAPAGAFYAFPNLEHYETDSYKLSKYLIDEGKVGVYPGIGFGQRGEGRIRISYASSLAITDSISATSATERAIGPSGERTGHDRDPPR